jgi:hypothetical protein
MLAEQNHYLNTVGAELKGRKQEIRQDLGLSQRWSTRFSSSEI